MIGTNEVIMKESFGLCPYMASRERTSLKNARIRNEERWLDEELETDIPEMRSLIDKVKDHARRRTDHSPKNNWIPLEKEYIKARNKHAL